MNILIVTNTYTPHVGGVARSVAAFDAEYRKRGHRTLIIAPEFPNMPEESDGVFRVPAIQNFNASDFSVVLPIHPSLSDAVDAFDPTIVHSQHPFLLGMTAARIARRRSLPLVFTHHTLYERYTHYVPGDSAALKRFTIELATCYANLTDLVFAPSESIRDLIEQRGVTTPVAVVPTGVSLENFSGGDGRGFRKRAGIPADAFVVGHLGRLAPEKNLELLARAVADFVAERPDAYFLVVGEGPAEQDIRDCFASGDLSRRLHIAGVLEREPLNDALHAMNVFAFASTSETQGMVLTEAMAAGLPVVALDAPGVREVVADGCNGRLLAEHTVEALSSAIREIAARSPAARGELERGALETAAAFSMPRSADKALAHFESLRAVSHDIDMDDSGWQKAVAAIKTELELLKSVGQAGDAAMGTGIFSKKKGG